MGQLDDIVWKETLKLLKSPSRLKKIYERLGGGIRKKGLENSNVLDKKKSKLLKQLSRLNDLYVMGTIDIDAYKQQHAAKKELLAKIEMSIKAASVEKQTDEELRQLLESFKNFSDTIKEELDEADFETKRRAVEEVVKFVEIKQDEVIINFAVPLRRKKSTLNKRILR